MFVLLDKLDQSNTFEKVFYNIDRNCNSFNYSAFCTIFCLRPIGCWYLSGLFFQGFLGLRIVFLLMSKRPLGTWYT